MPFVTPLQEHRPVTEHLVLELDLPSMEAHFVFEALVGNQKLKD